jgi:hypothetical protein
MPRGASKAEIRSGCRWASPRLGRRGIRRPWRDDGRRGRQHRRHIRRHPTGARLVQKARSVLAPGSLRLGRRLEQQDVGLGQGGPDHEPAERLGRGEAGRAEHSRAAVDVPRRPKGRKAATSRFSRTTGAIWNFSGNKPAAKSLPRSSNSSPRARVTTSRPSTNCATSRPGPSRGRPKGRSTITRRAAATRSCRSRPLRRRRRSRCRSICRRP